MKYIWLKLHQYSIKVHFTQRLTITSLRAVHDVKMHIFCFVVFVMEISCICVCVSAAI